MASSQHLTPASERARKHTPHALRFVDGELIALIDRSPIIKQHWVVMSVISWSIGEDVYSVYL